MTFDDGTHVDLNDPDDVVAHHEAGHAVMSWMLRSFVGAVTIERDARHLGGTEVWVLAPPLVDEAGKIVEKDQYTADELTCFEDATMIAMAGADRRNDLLVAQDVRRGADEERVR